ncbi:hypothetical protein ACFL4Y_01825 [Gemmatimonadota bacterium]
MRRSDLAFTQGTTVLAFVAIAGLLYQIIGTRVWWDEVFVRQDTIAPAEWIMIAGVLGVALFAGVSIVWICDRVYRARDLPAAVGTALLLASAYFVLLGGQKAMADEIAREFRMGTEILGESVLFYTALIIQIIYALVVLTYLLPELHRLRSRDGGGPQSSDG